MIPNLLDGVFQRYGGGPFDPNQWVTDTFQMIYLVLSWDVISGGLAFTLGLGIALYAVQRIRQAFEE